MLVDILCSVLEVEYVTVYVPEEDEAKSIVPVLASITNPAVELNVPPAVPVTVGVGSLSDGQ